MFVGFFFFNDTATTEIYTLSLHDALPIWRRPVSRRAVLATGAAGAGAAALAVLWKGNDLSQILNRVQDLTRANQGALSDPRVRAGHLLRRAGFGGTAADIDRFAAMTTTAMTQAVLDYQQTSNAVLDGQLPTLDLTAAKGPNAGAVQSWWLQRMVQTALPRCTSRTSCIGRWRLPTSTICSRPSRRTRR